MKSRLTRIALGVLLAIVTVKAGFFSNDGQTSLSAELAQSAVDAKNALFGNEDLTASLSEEQSEAAVAAEPTETTPIEEQEWRAITPFDIKNPVTLFSKDWMALAVGKEGDMNAMTIAWGTLGELWRKHVVIVYVSSSRHTHSFMERNKYFTLTAFPDDKRQALQYIGTHSGRDEKDKVANAGLTTEFTELGNPIFKEANLAIECKIIYNAPFEPHAIDPETYKFYDNGVGIHSMYVGEIINVWKK